MPSTLTAYRIFVASPGGLDEFRRGFRTTVEKYNDADAVRRGALFIPVGWEQTLGGMGRPQHIINADLRECDYCVLVLRDRWGSAADTAPGSPTGTEEEYQLACQLYADVHAAMRQIVVFFVAVDPGHMSDPGQQLAKVLEFRKKVEQEKTLLFHQVEREEDFEDVVRRHLADWTHGHERMASGAIDPPVQSVEEAMAGDSDLQTDAAVPAAEPIAAAAELISQARYTEAESLLAESVSRDDDPRALVAYGELLTRLGRRNQAIEALRRAVELSSQLGNAAMTAQALEAQAEALDASGSFEDAIASACQAIGLYQSLDDAVGEARMHILLGERYRWKAEIESALENYRSAIARATKGASEPVLANAWIGMGEVFRDEQRFEEALGALRTGAEIKHRLGVTDLGDVHAALGATFEGLQDDESAEREFRISVDLFRQKRDRAGIADAADHLGQICLRRGDVESAEEAFRESALNFEGVQNIEGAVDAYLSLGRLQLTRSDYEKASGSLRTALSLARRQRGADAGAAQSEIATLLDQALGSLTTDAPSGKPPAPSVSG